MTERGLVARNADEPQGGTVRCGTCHLVYGRRVTDAGATPAKADLHTDIDGSAGPLEPGRHLLHACDRIDPARERELGIAVKLCGDPAQRGGIHKLIGDYEIAHTERPVDACLADGRDGDGRGPRLELAGQQLRGHVGLAVWRELDAPVTTPAGHRREVV